MTNPKFRRLDYALYQSLEKAKVPGGTYQVILVVIDFTIGYRKEAAPIPLSTFQKKTGLSRQGVIGARDDALRRHIIKISRSNTNARNPSVYSLNTEYSEWIIGEPQFTSNLRSTSEPQFTSRLVNHSSLDQVTTVHYPSKLPVPATPIAKETLNKTIKKGIITKENLENHLTRYNLTDDFRDLLIRLYDLPAWESASVGEDIDWLNELLAGWSDVSLEDIDACQKWWTAPGRADGHSRQQWKQRIWKFMLSKRPPWRESDGKTVTLKDGIREYLNS